MAKKLIKVMDTSFRDGFQSVYGARVFVDDFLPALKAAVDAGIKHFETAGGARFQARYAYYSDNLSEIKGHAGMSAVSAMWRMSFLLGHKLTIQPMTYGRLLFGPQQPVPLRNMIGGDWFGHYSYQQMPFAGVGYMEFTNSHFIAAQLHAQQQLGNKHYILLKLAAAQHADKFSKLLDQKTTFGVQGVYCFNSLLGPVGAALGYSNLTKRVNFYVNLGYEF